jgi:hypothetical protein
MSEPAGCGPNSRRGARGKNRPAFMPEFSSAAIFFLQKIQALKMTFF